MKQVKLFLLTLLAIMAGNAAWADSYVVNFNEPITVPSSNTSNPLFAVASGWTRVCTSGEGDGYGPYYMRYYYSKDGGIDGSGCLRAMQQEAPQDYGDGSPSAVTDYLITPKLSGTVTIKVKAYNYADKSYVRVYKTIDSPTSVNDVDATALPVEITDANNNTKTAFATNEWRTVTFTVSEPTRLALRLQYVTIDDFVVEGGSAEKAKGLSIVSASPTETTGLIYWEQQSNGKVLVKYDVTVKNTGELTLTTGDENYSVSIVNRGSQAVCGTTAVPQTLEPGETSEVFAVQAELDPWTGNPIHLDLRENITNTVMQRAWGTYVAYEPKLLFRAEGSTSNSSLTELQNYGMVSEDETRSFELKNVGTAALTVKSITLPEGFTSKEVPTTEFVLEKGTSQVFDITLPASTKGTYNGTLTIVYLDKTGAEATYTLQFSGNVVSGATWSATFDNDKENKPVWPQGAIAENGITTDYTYKSGLYDIFLKLYNSSSYATANNRFITPKLHAAAGDQLAFDVKRIESGASYFLKVYVSTDRATWGEPVFAVTADKLTSTFQTERITFDTEGDYYVAFAIYGTAVDNIVGLEQVEVAHDLYIKEVKLPSEVELGANMTASIDIIPLTEEKADDYYVAYYFDGDTVATAQSVDLVASTTATSSRTFTIRYKPTVKGSHTTYIAVVFKDETIFKTAEQTLQVIYEPELRFCDVTATEGYYGPTARSQAINFGRVRDNQHAMQFKVYNWGAAPLKVKSITVPQGFTSSLEEVTVESKQFAPMEITFSAETPGNYEGKLTITYENGAGADQQFQLPISGIMLDASLFFASFDDEKGNASWPAGSVHQSNVSIINGGTYSTPEYYITSSSDTLNYFITPKLSGLAGEALQFDARLYSSTWDGNIKVYAAATREALLNKEGQLLLDVTTDQMKTDAYTTFSAALPADGEYFLGMAISNRPYVDNLYGLHMAAVAHDIQLVKAALPEAAMQNVMATATLQLLNLGLNAEAAGAYTLTAYVDGEAVPTLSNAPALPVATMLTETPVLVTMGFKYDGVGEHELYVEVKADDFVVRSETVKMTFFPEEERHGITVGTPNGVMNEAPLNLNYKLSEAVALYDAQTLAIYGLEAGNKITSLTFRGYRSSSDEFTSNLTVAYEWTADQTQANPAAFDATGMEVALQEDNHQWLGAGTATGLADMLVITFDEPLTYEEGQSLRLYFRSESEASKIVYFEKSLATAGCYRHQTDGLTLSNEWQACALPVLHIGIEPTVPTPPIIDCISNVKAATAPSVLYDLQGRRVNNAKAKGLYIQQGKMVLVK